MHIRIILILSPKYIKNICESEEYKSYKKILFTLTFNRLTVPSGCSVELSHEGYDFLSAVFEKYDQDRDYSLRYAHVNEISIYYIVVILKY